MAKLGDYAMVWKNFHEAVNMTAGEIEAWLATEESHKVGFKPDGASESVGHAAGRRIVAILHGTKAELEGGDYAHMRKVAGYVRRHRAQGRMRSTRCRPRGALFADELEARSHYVS